MHTRTGGGTRARTGPRTGVLAALVAVAAAATACTSARATAPDWQPKQDAPYQAEPGAPGTGPSAPGGASPPAPGGASPSPTGSGPDPNVLATHLTAPTGIALLPDGTALVGERTTGRIVRVQPQAGQPTPTVQTLGGLDSSGDGGLLDLAVSPTFGEDGLVYAYVTTATDNEVVHFTVGGAVTPVVTGIPKAATGNVGRIGFDAGGDLLVATGPAGGGGADPTSLAGKVLRYDEVGRPAAGDPTPGSPVLSRGLTGADGLCLATGLPVSPTGAAVLVGSAADDTVSVATPGAGTSGPVARLPASARGLGGCALLGNRLFVTSLDGAAVLGADLVAPAGTPRAGDLKTVLSGTYGRLRTVVASPADGTLWLTTSNRDGRGRPVPDDERVVRITPAGGAGGGSKA